MTATDGLDLTRAQAALQTKIDRLDWLESQGPLQCGNCGFPLNADALDSWIVCRGWADVTTPSACKRRSTFQRWDWTAQPLLRALRRCGDPVAMSQASGLTATEAGADAIVFHAGSGAYRFTLTGAAD